MIEASKLGTKPKVKKSLIIGESLQYVSLNVYLDFVYTLSKDNQLTVDVDVLEKFNIDMHKFKKMIVNSQIKGKIVENFQSRTDTGKPLV